MPIVGHGIDIVETSRIRKLVEQHAEHFLDRVFTPLEQR
jgi:phosphopantetheinyl transferase (holo-ACP synthase)